MRNSLLAAALFVASVLCIAALSSGAAFISATLHGGLPVGNAIAWLGLLGLPSAALLLAARGSLIRKLAWVAFAGAIAWLPASLLLAGNLALNFSGGTGAIWLSASLGLFVLAVATLLLAAASAVIRRLRGAGTVRQQELIAKLESRLGRPGASK